MFFTFCNNIIVVQTVLGRHIQKYIAIILLLYVNITLAKYYFPTTFFTGILLPVEPVSVEKNI